MDFRLRAGTARCSALEANANPNLSAGEDFAQSALTAGMRYPEVLHRILQARSQLPGGVARPRR